MSKSIRILILALVAIALVALFGGTAIAGTHHNTTRYVPIQIVQYEFTYHHDGTLTQVTIQDSTGKITQFPCSPPAIAVNGNYSISCGRS